MIMKKLIIFMSLILSVVPLGAQTKYRGIVEGGYSFLQDNKSGLSFQVSTIHGVRLGSYFIGGGIGLEGNQIDNPAYNPQADVQLLDECPYIGLKTVSTTSVPVFFDFRSMWDRPPVDGVDTVDSGGQQSALFSAVASGKQYGSCAGFCNQVEERMIGVEYGMGVGTG